MMPVHHVAIREPGGEPRGRLAVHTAGSGIPLVLLHGFPLDHSMWMGQAPLAEKVRLIAPDLRGFGGTGGAGPASMAQQADDAVAVLDAVHVAEPAVFCGLSMGGYVAQHVAVRHPHRVRGLVLVDTKLEADTPEARAGRVDLAAKVGRLGQAILADAMIPRLLATSPEAVAAPHRAAVERLLRETILAQPVEAIQAALEALGARPDMTEPMRKVGVPTLLVVGAEDAITPPECLAAAERILPRARLLIVPRAGHMTPLEAPEVFNAAVLEFLSTDRLR
jgi:pimeloyl-ACP methyl ester carboxylesterase